MCPSRICRYAERLGAEGLNRMREKMIYFVPFTKTAPRTLGIYGPKYVANKGDKAKEDIKLVIIANKYAIKDIVTP